jgi:quercetin dioxygenase-like cupin family protein
MEIFRSRAVPFRAVDAASFTGNAQTRLLATSEHDTPVNVYHVHFEDKARTHWHTHSGSQWLFVTEGRIRAQASGGPVQDLDAGDVVVFAPGEKHWHGAAPGGRGVHLAVNVNVVTTWLEAVSDQEYGGHSGL